MLWDLWLQMCEDFDKGLIDGEDMRRYARFIFPRHQQTAVDAVIRHVESCSV